MKQGGPTGGVMPPTIVEPPVREEGQLVAKVGPNIGVKLRGDYI